MRAAIERLASAALVDEDGDPVEVEIRPGLTPDEIAAAERELGHAYPPALRDVLSWTSGIDGVLDGIDLTGLEAGQALEELFPEVATVATDGFGNSWGVDLLRENGRWGPIWYLAHDPPVALYQCDDLATFIGEVIRMHTPPFASLVDDVHEDRIFQIGRSNRGALTLDEAMASEDEVVRAFAAELDDGWVIVDVRDAVPGAGVSWGRYGPRTELRRWRDEQIFAVRDPKPKRRR